MTLIHPVPQFAREAWRDLDGTWQFAFDDLDVGLAAGWAHGLPQARPITVPFTYETKASGIDDPAHHEVVWYQKAVTLTAADLQNHVYLHFGGVDYAATVFVNGVQVGQHVGGYTRFDCDISASVHAGDNQISLRVTDSKSCEQPRGKQRWRQENFDCWYVQSTGIWKPVWLEFTAATRLEAVKMTPDLDAHAIAITAEVAGPDRAGLVVSATVTYQDQLITMASASVINGRAEFNARVALAGEPGGWSVPLWSPESPALFDVTFTLTAAKQTLDTVQSYFGMREIAINGDHVLLNGRDLYQRLILDQNYWPDSGLTPQSVDAMRADIELIKEMGYNGVRLHQTVADPRFLYLADTMGLLVWSEMAATYEFSAKAMAAFTDEWATIIRQNYNHPAIITWVPFNESWGIAEIATNKQQQAFTKAIYYLTKAYDPMRPVITNDGWEHTLSDIITLHDYEADGQVFFARYQDRETLLSGTVQHNLFKYPFAQGTSDHGQPVIISEFGGIAFATEEGWGYGDQVRDQASFMKRFGAIHAAIQELPYVTGYCYTQLTDVQQEQNGLLTIDRQPKLELDQIKAINNRRVH